MVSFPDGTSARRPVYFTSINLPAANFRWRRDHDAVAAFQSGDDLDAVAVRAADLDGAALDALTIDEKHESRAAVGLDRGLRHERHRLRHRRGGGVGLPQERHLDTHVGQEARVELLETDAHEDRRLLAIRGRHHRDHVGRDLPVGIGIEHRRHRLSRANAVDVALVDVDFDLERSHVDDRADACPRKARRPPTRGRPSRQAAHPSTAPRR
jgi:hypothetical protein